MFLDLIRAWQSSIYAFALGWLAAWFMSFLSSAMVSIIAIVILVCTLSITGVLQCNKPKETSFTLVQDEEEFEPFEELTGDFQ